MEYLSAYWDQLKVFYTIFFRGIFAKERNLDNGVAEFVSKPGFLWEMLEVHKWVWRCFVSLVGNIVQLLTCYLAMVLLCIFLLSAPLFILAMFPIFTWGRYKRIREAGSRL